MMIEVMNVAHTPIEVYERLREKLGDDGAKILVEYVHQEIQRGAATKEDLHIVRDELREDNQSLRDEMHKENQNLRNELYAIRDEMREDNQNLRNELYAIRDEMRKGNQDLRNELTNFEWRMRLYFALLALLMVLLNPKVTEFFARLVGLATR